MFGVPVVALFVGLGDGEEIGLLERLADELKTDGQTTLGETARDRHPRQTGEVDAERVDIEEVHCKRIGFFPDFERRHG